VLSQVGAEGGATLEGGLARGNVTRFGKVVHRVHDWVMFCKMSCWSGWCVDVG
jgi:hypothetical protein